MHRLRVKTKNHPAFTIVELLIVIVVIAVLAAISFVAYQGVQGRAETAALESDLAQASKQLSMSKVTQGSFPSGDGTPPENLTSSTGTTFEYTSDGTSFCLSATRGTNGYHVTDSGSPQEGVCPGHSGPGGSDGEGDDAPDGITIGSQTWAAANLNVGTMVSGATTQTDNSVIEKYCFGNNEVNCETYGGLYQWGEAMQYSTSEGAQGICPAGWHIPTDEEWKTLGVSLGMTQAEADATGWRGTDQGAQLKPGGSSGLDLPLAGYRSTSGGLLFLGSYADLWSSSESGSHAWRWRLASTLDTFYRHTGSQAFGLSVRCLKN